MARKARENYDSSYFHVVTQGYEKKYIFNEEYLKEKYLNLLIEEMNNFEVEILEYCIMDNHAHILLYCSNVKQMSSYMKKVNSKYATFYNRKYERVGNAFRDRFLSEPIKSEKHLYSCMAYVHMNPVIAKMVARPELYKYSSYKDFLNKSGIVTDSVLVKLFGSNENYFDLFNFIHFETGIGIEYKKDLPNLSFQKSKQIIEYVLRECSIGDLKEEDIEIQKYFFRLFFRKGVGIYHMEKIFKMDHRTIKKRIII